MLRNTRTDWGTIAKLLHWVGALMIVVLLAHGWYMTHGGIAREARIGQYSWHAAIGYDFLVLLVLRILWRWMSTVPPLPADLKPWERLAAHLGHLGLYVLMLAVTLTGWALAGTFRTPIGADLFGIPFPMVTSGGNRELHELFEGSHMVLAYLLAALVVIHIAGALRHRFEKKNDVLERMTWRRA